MMCSVNVRPEAEAALAALLLDLAAALDPDHPEQVVIGPVDFGSEIDPYLDDSREHKELA